MFLLNVVVLSIYEHMTNTNLFDEASEITKWALFIYLMIMLAGDVKRVMN